jgi:hypothetical protein
MPRLASPLGLEPPPASLLGILALITLAYVASAETIKRVFYRAAGSPRRWGSTGNRG